MAISLGTVKNRHDHAVHNKRACEHLCKVTEFPDWVITTAFYCALHFIDSKIFPLTIQGKSPMRFLSLDQYYGYQRKFDSDMPDKHEFRRELAAKRLPKNVAATFRRLSDASSTARYSDYSAFTFQQAQVLYIDLLDIEKTCSTDEPTASAK